MSKAYPKYKPSGVEWLGDVPEHWEVKRTRFILSMNPSKQEISHLDPETELAFLPMEAVGEDGSLRLDSTRPISEVNSGYTFFAEGDVAFAKITPCFENGKGAILRNIGTGFGFGTTELTVMRTSEKLDAEYLYYITVSNDFRHNGEAWMYGAGGQKRVPDEFVKEFRFGYPPLPEQQAIAAFLDRETGRIDALIAKKERLLELLAEQRTALISRAVTKGLSEIVSRGDAEFAEWKKEVKYKPSGVEWLGDVPEHWEVKDLKHLISQNAQGIKIGPFGSSIKLEMMVSEEDGFIVYGQEHVIANDFSIGKRFLPFHLKHEFSVYLIKPKDLLVTMMGTAGRCQIVPDDIREGIIDSHLMRIRLNQKVIFPQYFRWFFDESISVKFYFNLFAKGTIMQGLNGTIVKELTSPLPPLPEQQAIAAFLDRETAKIDALSAKVTTVIERLKEYRTALISSAVTGKIDVREAV